MNAAVKWSISGVIVQNGLNCSNISFMKGKKKRVIFSGMYDKVEDGAALRKSRAAVE